MPRVGRGLYPLKGCVQWSINYWKDRATGRVADTEKKRKSELENKILQAKVDEATGHLINRQEVSMVWEGAFLRLGKTLDALPSSIGRECNLSTDVIRIMRSRIDTAREGFVRDSAEFIEVVDDGTAKKRA